MDTVINFIITRNIIVILIFIIHINIININITIITITLPFIIIPRRTTVCLCYQLTTIFWPMGFE